MSADLPPGYDISLDVSQFMRDQNSSAMSSGDTAHSSSDTAAPTAVPKEGAAANSNDGSAQIQSLFGMIAGDGRGANLAPHASNQKHSTSKLPEDAATKAAAAGIRTERVTIASHNGAPVVAVATAEMRQHLEFEPEDMLVEDLRQECRGRKLATSGPKNVLVRRLRAAVTQDPSLPRHRMSDDNKKAKRNLNKREPQRDEFDTEDEYQDAWQRWRAIRDHNNESVKRSRENARHRKHQHEAACRERERENSQLATEVDRLKDQVVLLTKVLKTPEALSMTDREQIGALMSGLGPYPGEGLTSTAGSSNPNASVMSGAALASQGFLQSIAGRGEPTSKREAR